MTTAERPSPWIGVALLIFGLMIGGGGLKELVSVIAEGRWPMAFPSVSLVVIAAAALVVGSRMTMRGADSWRDHPSS